VNQLSLLDLPPVGAHRRRDPRSSSEAAATCDASRQKDQIVALLATTVRGYTADELAQQMVPSPHRSVVASRLAQLRRDGLAEPWGFRENSNGRNVQIWVRTYPREVVVRVAGGRL